jgi:hypothetical protein
VHDSVGLPAKGSIFALLPFDSTPRPTLHLVGVVCMLKRAGAAAPSGRQ